MHIQFSPIDALDVHPVLHPESHPGDSWHGTCSPITFSEAHGRTDSIAVKGVAFVLLGSACASLVSLFPFLSFFLMN